MPFELLDSETVYEGRAFRVRRDRVCLPDGRAARLDIVEHVGAVVILPVDEEGRLLFVRQYRHAAGLDLLELPAGTLNPDEAPEACARREVREETGMAAGRLDPLGGFYLAPGYSTEYMHVFLATDLHYDPLEADPDEFLSVEKVAIRDVFDTTLQGISADAKSLAACFLARWRLESLAK